MAVDLSNPFDRLLNSKGWQRRENGIWSWQRWNRYKTILSVRTLTPDLVMELCKFDCKGIRIDEIQITKFKDFYSLCRYLDEGQARGTFKEMNARLKRISVGYGRRG